MLAPDWQPWEPLLAGGGGAIVPRPPGRDATLATITSHESNRVTLVTDAPEDGILILTESDMPGWHAFVDGQARPILRADYVLRAIPRSAGPHEVTFVYLPSSFKLGAFLSSLALLTLAALTARCIRRCRSLPTEH